MSAHLVVLAETSAWVSVRLPDGREGWLERGLGRLLNAGQPAPSIPAMHESARSLVCVPYLWGGTAPAAYDCSGFVYRVFAAHGLTLARDAQDQALLGAPLAENALEPGDVLFYSSQPDGTVTHVALYWRNGKVISGFTRPFAFKNR